MKTLFKAFDSDTHILDYLMLKLPARNMDSAHCQSIIRASANTPVQRLGVEMTPRIKLIESLLPLYWNPMSIQEHG